MASPLAAIGIAWYLQQYAYRAEISIGIYFVAGLLAATLAFITMFYQSLRASHMNPVVALRND